MPDTADHLPESALRLETARLTLAPLSLTDQGLAAALLGDADVMRFVSDPMSVAEVASFMTDATRRGAGGRLGLWVVRDKANGAALGTCLLTPVPIDQDETDWSLLEPDSYPPGQIEVGYLLSPSAWGRGFATEVCARMLQFAFEQTRLDAVVATTDPDNLASQHVLRKCGMRDLGPRRAYGHDGVSWFEITRDDWRNAQA